MTAYFRLQRLLADAAAHDRPSYAAMVLRQAGAGAYADAIADQVPDAAWFVTWAHWRAETDPLVIGKHEGITAICAGSNANTLLAASGAKDGSLLVWDLVNGRRFGPPIEGHTGAVNSVALSTVRDRLVLVSGGADGTVRVWDVTGGALLHDPICRHGSAVKQVAVAHFDGLPLTVSCTADEIRIWETSRGRQIGPPLKGHHASIRSVAISTLDDQPVIVSAGADNDIRVWDIAHGRQLGDALRAHTGGGVLTLAPCHLDGKPIVLSSGYDGLKAWDLADRVHIGETIAYHDSIEGRADAPRGTAMAKLNGRPIAVCSGSLGRIVAWDVAESTRACVLSDGYANVVSLAAIESLVVFGDDTGVIGLWDLRSATPLEPGESDLKWPLWSDAVAISEVGDEAVALTGGPDGTVRRWNVDTGQPIGIPMVGHNGGINTLATFAAANMAASGGDDKSLRLWDLRTGAPLGRPMYGHTKWVMGLAEATLDGRPIAMSGAFDGTVRLWDLESFEQIGPPLLAGTDEVRSVTFTNLKGRELAVAACHNRVRAWDLQTREVMWTNYVDSWCVKVCSYGIEPAFVSVGNDGCVHVWDCLSGQLLRAPLQGHRGQLHAVAVVTFDGVPLVASGGKDATVRLWDLVEGRGILSINVDSVIQSIAVGPNNELLVGQKMGVMAIRLTDNLIRDGSDAVNGRLLSQPLTASEEATKSHTWRGEFFYRHGRSHGSLYNEAVTELDNLRPDETASARILSLKADALRMVDENKRALEVLNVALELEPGNTFALGRRGEVYRMLDRYDEAVTDLTSVLVREPENVFARNSRGSTYRLLGRYTEAIDDLDRAILLEPTDPFTLCQRGATLQRLYRYADALHDLNLALSQVPRSWSALCSRGDTHVALGQFDAALEDYEAALTEYPTDQYALRGKALALAASGRVSKALESLRAAAIADPHSAWVHHSYAVLWSRGGAYASAHRSLDRAIALNGQYRGSFLATKAQVYIRSGHPALAVRACVAALHVDRKSHGAWANLGQALLLLGQIDRAEKAFDQALRLREARESLVLTAAIRWHRGDIDSAVDMLRRGQLVGDDCTHYRLAELQGLCLAGLQQPGAALSLLRSASPFRMPGDVYQPQLYKLFSYPPLPGIELLRQQAVNGLPRRVSAAARQRDRIGHLRLRIRRI